MLFKSRRSLHQQLAWHLIPPLLVLLALNLYWAYQEDLHTVNLAYDRSLTASISAISERSFSSEGQIKVDVPYSAFEVFDSGLQERIFYAVIAPDHRIITGYENLPIPTTAMAEGKVDIRDAVYLGVPIRIATLAKRMYDPKLGDNDTILIAFAETMESRTQLVRLLFMDSLKRQGLLIILGLVLLLLSLSRALRPLIALRTRVLARPEEDLTPIPVHEVPGEVRPLIDALNYHIARFSAMLQARKRFLADAAHQMRTPLTILRTQVEYGLRQQDPEEMRRTLQAVLNSIANTQRLTNQMLALSQAEAVNGLMQERAPVDLAALVRQVALALSPLAIAKNIELAFDSEDAIAPISGNANLLHEMLNNLIDNAIRYTPPGGKVAIHLGNADSPANPEVVLTVCDNGVGIPPDEYEKVFKRFYRILGEGKSEGSGLGLAIVKEICMAHGGRVSLGPTRLAGAEQGLGVELRLPTLRDSA